MAGSASFGGNELAEGFVRKGERLTVQACRFRGERVERAGVGIHFTRAGASASRAMSRWST